MKIVSVIPIARGVFKEELDYFTTQPVAPGAIVSVPVRNRTIDALVTACRPAEEAKSAIRTAAFPLRKIERVRQTSFFTPELMAAARRLADYFAGSLGQTLKGLIPAEILTGAIKTIVPAARPSSRARGQSVTIEKYVLQESDEERLIYYKGLIREEFAKGASVFLCLPTLADVKKALESLERGIAEYTVVCHHDLGRRALLDGWRRVLASEHPLLVVATPSFLALPRADVSTIIIDRENSPAYKALTRPFLDYRLAAEFLAEAGGQRLVLGDFILRVETIHRFNQNLYQVLTPIKHHIVSGAEQKIVNVKSSPARFRVLSDDLIAAVAGASQNNERFFLFVHRRGLSPLVVCQDCGAAVVCRNCQSPVSLHQAAENFLLCHHCGARRSAAEKCAVCGGWRLIGLGIGLELVAKELAEYLPLVKLFKLDSDRIRSGRQAEALVKKFLATPGGVLVGTEMTMYYLRDKIENAAVAAIDSLFALPDYRINERVFNLLLRLRALASKSFLIQMRNVKSRLFDLASRGSLLDFYRQELAERREYGYPPFKLFIKISLAGRREDVLPAMRALERDLAGYELDILSGAGTRPGQVAANLILRLNTPDWPDPRLLEILKSLPPRYCVTVDPENLLD
ncbi:MAG: hypothetical protein HYT46_00880 [Candidatus Vogelbacteria bacterium]|nr:hypothetical protein [Candidatus Vogelbacteria bacterium]